MSKVLRITVSVDQESLDYLNRIGSGSPTNGIRTLVMLAREQTLPPKVRPDSSFVVPAEPVPASSINEPAVCAAPEPVDDTPDNVKDILADWS